MMDDMDDLVTFLRARLDETRAALLRYRDGHEGPCLNYRGQDPEGYDEYDSCYLHIETAEATPYRDVAFGLADIDAKRQLVDAAESTLRGSEGDSEVDHYGALSDADQTLALLADLYADHPDYREEWRP